MKKALILPSTTGQGDLSIAITLADALKPYFNVTTAYFAENAHSRLLQEIPGERVLFSPASHPDHSCTCEKQLWHLAGEIKNQAADVVIALNESFFALGAFLAHVPVIQLTHLFNRGLIRTSRWIVHKAIARTPSLPKTMAELKRTLRSDPTSALKLISTITRLQRSSAIVRAVRKIRRTVSPFSESRLRMELVSRYGHVIGTSYLSQLFSDSLIVHSIFPPQNDALAWVTADRRAFGQTAAVFTNSLPGTASNLKNTSAGGPKILLLTFGGIDHPITPGMERLLRLLNSATAHLGPNLLKVLITGRVTETKRSFFESALSKNPLFKAGAIQLLGSLEHQEHLRLIETADLVMTQPGYSTICELSRMAKPFVLFYGLAPYYEQYVNFVSALRSGTSISIAGKPWLQVGEYGRFGSRRTAREKALQAHLASILNLLVRGRLPASRKPHLSPTSQFYADAVALHATRLANTGGSPLEAVA